MENLEDHLGSVVKTKRAYIIKEERKGHSLCEPGLILLESLAKITIRRLKHIFRIFYVEKSRLYVIRSGNRRR